MRRGFGNKIVKFYNINTEFPDPLFYWKINDNIYFNYEDLPKHSEISTVSIEDITFKMRLDVREFVQCEIYHQRYEPEETKVFLRFLEKGDVIFDLGANVGYYALLAASKVGNQGKVYSFEPSKDNYAKLLENVKLNHFSNIVLNQLAVSDQKGETFLYSNSRENDGMKSFVKHFFDHSRMQKVQITSLDDYVQENGIQRVDFIKCDIEGAEILAFKGGKQLLTSSEAPHLLFEVNAPSLIKLGFSDIELQKLLFEYKYQLYEICEGKLVPLRQAKQVEGSINLFASKRI
jgi:FkbM family methyltransferase